MYLSLALRDAPRRPRAHGHVSDDARLGVFLMTRRRRRREERPDLVEAALYRADSDRGRSAMCATGRTSAKLKTSAIHVSTPKKIKVSGAATAAASARFLVVSLTL